MVGWNCSQPNCIYERDYFEIWSRITMLFFMRSTKTTKKNNSSKNKAGITTVLLCTHRTKNRTFAAGEEVLISYTWIPDKVCCTRERREYKVMDGLTSRGRGRLQPATSTATEQCGKNRSGDVQLGMLTRFPASFEFLECKSTKRETEREKLKEDMFCWSIAANRDGAWRQPEMGQHRPKALNRATAATYLFRKYQRCSRRSGWNVKWFHEEKSFFNGSALFIIHGTTVEKPERASLVAEGGKNCSGSTSRKQSCNQAVTQNKVRL